MFLAALVLVILVAVGVVMSRRSSSRATSFASKDAFAPGVAASDASLGSLDVPGYMKSLLDRWSSAGLITDDQVDTILDFERASIASIAPKVKRTRVHAIAEALGYLGGMLGLVGVIVLVVDFWDEFGRAVQVGVPFGTTLLMVVAGMLVPENRSFAMVRLRTFLWTLAVVASGVSAWVSTDVVFDADEPRLLWLGVGIATSLVSVLLWFGRTRPIQQFTAIAGAMIALGTFIGEFASAGFSGIGVWFAGAVLVGSSIGKTGLRDGVNVLSGSLSVAVGAYLTVVDWRGPGFLFVITTGLLLVVPAVVEKFRCPPAPQMITGVIGAVVLVQGIPASLAHFSNEAGLMTGLVLWMFGVGALVLVSLGVVRTGLILLLVGGASIVGGAAITGTQSVGFATMFGLATSITLIGYGARPGKAVMSVFGLLGIMVFIPWTISHFFPGEGRVPLLIIVSGLVLVGVAVLLTKISGRLRGEVRMGGLQRVTNS